MNESNMMIQFWGVRGSLPVPGKDTVRYGGNTSCVTLTINNHFFIFDAGSGIKKLSEHLVKQQKPISAKIFITHPHFDHINTLPYFFPLYQKGNEFEIFSACKEDTTVEQLLFKQMDKTYFPITPQAFQATISYRKLREESLNFGDIHIQGKRLNHPGICLGYRVDYHNKSVCYITDNELYLNDHPNYNQEQINQLVEFINETNLLIIDTTYTDEEYVHKVDWGHSCVSQVVDLADKGKVKRLCLFHHDPSQTDNDIDLKLKTAQKLLSMRASGTQCIAPHEGDILYV